MASSVKLEETLKARLQILAASRRRSPHWMMREAIQQYVDREEARESFGREAAAAWADYQTTGLHLTGAELRSWLARWGEGVGSDLPECHT